MRVAILGAGGGGCSAAAELAQAGHDLHLWARSSTTIAPHRELGGVAYEGVLGEGTARADRVTDDLQAAIDGVDLAVVALPTFLHAPTARALSGAGWPEDKLVILNPGHTGGALEFRHAYAQTGRTPPPLVEFSTLTYVARKYSKDTVTVTGRAGCVRAASLGGTGRDLETAANLFPGASPVEDVLAAGLSNVNMVLHPPGAVLGAAWVEARAGDFTFYVDGMTSGVARTMKQLDAERLAVARAFGHDLPNLIGEMKAIGTVEQEVTDHEDFRAAIAGGKANARIKAPDSLDHRYYKEDFGHGLLPFLALAAIAEVETPTAAALFALAEAFVGADYRGNGRTAQSMGIAGLGKRELMEKVGAV